ncbi:BlaI/MecI/CopY family transcriptional regulator [Kordiimonas laminariae]|uniref:BlaI/MecI/CopY family transcriptional regulator n=1 Tax=Kordiimonas laminariae TaxID=2917717 RepID=UPI001FF66E1D|nr:BlaI/MecI/CopY family transcriptional regulator [Kordiimonas laminariae]MCK0070626.1 BlaI/MecI/CopY family transcriptional regulator [Kordiimonas laminariae]
MTDSNTHISEAESKVMEALWRTYPLSAEDITGSVGEEQNWRTGTVKTLLNRLLSKGAISAEKQGKKYLYSPVLARDEYLSTEGESVLNRLFGGSVSSLVSHFSKHEKLDQKDIAELKKLIGELGDD